MSYILQSPHNKKIVLRKNLAQVNVPQNLSSNYYSNLFGRQVEQFCSNLKRVIDLVESDPEKLTVQDSFVYAASTLYVKIVLVLTSAYKREKESQQSYDEIQDQLVEILNWTNR